MRAILGRDTLYFGETRRMILAENIVNAFTARKRSENWAAWANNNVVMSRVLSEIEVLIDTD